MEWTSTTGVVGVEWTSITVRGVGGVDFNNAWDGVGEWTSLMVWGGVGESTSITTWVGGGVDFNNGAGWGWSGLQ